MKIAILALSLVFATLSQAQATEIYTCKVTASVSAVSFRKIRIAVDGSKVSAEMENYVTMPWSEISAEPGKEFQIDYSNLEGAQKVIHFVKNSYDHYAFNLTFSRTAGVVEQETQMDCSDPTHATAFLSCEFSETAF